MSVTNLAIDWLSNNYQWLFSGVGVVLLIELFRLLKKNYFQKKVLAETQSSRRKKDKLHLLEVSPSEIIQKKKHLSEIEFQNYFNSFDGHSVTWEGNIGTVTLDNNDKQTVTIQITFPSDGFSSLRAFFSIRMSDFPSVKLFKSGDTAKVNGQISKPNWPLLDLVNVKILEWKKNRLN